MRVGIDIDDTICNTFDIFLPYICKFYNLDYATLKKEKLNYGFFSNTYDDYYIVAKDIYKKIVSTLSLRRGVVKYLNKIKKLGYDIVFITARNSIQYDNPYQISYDYLVKNNIPFDTLITDVSDKGEVCLEEKIDIFFDDDIDNYNIVKKRGIDTYLFTIESNKKYKNVNRVKNFRQIYKILKGKKNGRGKNNN